MLTGCSRLKENAIRLLTDARLRQCETLVHVAVEETQHVTAIRKAGILAPRVAGRERQQSPQGLLKGGVHAMNHTVHGVNVQVALGGHRYEDDVVADANLVYNLFILFKMKILFLKMSI